jgi:hypothetical protein
MYVGLEKSRVRDATLKRSQVIRLPSKSIGEASRGADFDGVPPWRPLNQ